MLKYLEDLKSGRTAVKAPQPVIEDASLSSSDVRHIDITLNNMRKTIAKRLTASKVSLLLLAFPLLSLPLSLPPSLSPSLSLLLWCHDHYISRETYLTLMLSLIVQLISYWSLGQE